MSSLEDLTALASQADTLEREAARRKTAACEISGVRKGPKALAEGLCHLKDFESRNYPEAPKLKAILAAEALLRDDLLRVAEMDLEAQARRMVAKARAIRAAIAVYCDEPAPAGEVAS